MRGKEGVSLGTCRAHTSQASRMRVAYASQLYNYLLRFSPDNAPPFKKGRPQSFIYLSLNKTL